MNLGTISGQVGNLTSSQAAAFDIQITNEAYADIASRFRWSWLQSTTTVPLVASQRGYTILGTTPTIVDFDSPISVLLELAASGSRIELGRMDTQTFDKYTGHCFTNSQPMFWTMQGGTAASTSATVVSGGQQQIIVSPPPTAVANSGVNLIVRYWRSTASIEMTAASDVPLLPAQYHRMIIMRACSMAMTRNLMPQDAVGFERDFQEQLTAAIAAEQAMWSSDNNTLILKAVPQTPLQVPVTQAKYAPDARPLPA